MVRYLIVAVMTLLASVAGGWAAGLGAWQIAALALGSTLLLQVAVVAYVVLASITGPRATKPQARSGESDGYAILLPK